MFSGSVEQAGPLITVWLQVRTKLARMPDVTAPLAILFALQISRISYVWCVRFSPSFLSAPIFHRLWSKEERVNGIAELCIFAPQRMMPPYSSTEVAMAIGVS